MDRGAKGTGSRKGGAKGSSCAYLKGKKVGEKRKYESKKGWGQ